MSYTVDRYREDTVTVASEAEVMALAEGIASKCGLHGGVWMDNAGSVWAHCDEEICDVCDGHLVAMAYENKE